MTTIIHPTAIVDPSVELGEDVKIGPNAIIEAGARIGDRTTIGAMVHIQGATTLGPDNQVWTGVTLGLPPQYVGFSGVPTRLTIGARNVIREYASIHRGLNDESQTTLGDDCFIMGFSHIAHDCHVGNRVIIANGALLAGHVSVDDRAFISGNAVVHQFCRIGRLVMVGGLARITNDVPPFTIAEGLPAKIRGLNAIGLRRADFPSHVRMELKRLLRQIFCTPGLTVSQSVAAINPLDHSAEAKEFIDFFKTSKRGVTAFSLLTRAAGAKAEEEE